MSVIARVKISEAETVKLVEHTRDSDNALYTTWGTGELLVTDDGRSRWALLLLAEWRGVPLDQKEEL